MFIHLRGASDGSKTNTVVAAKSIPSSDRLPKALPPLFVDATKVSPGHTSSSAQPPLHWTTSHCKCTSEPERNVNDSSKVHNKLHSNHKPSGNLNIDFNVAMACVPSAFV